MPIYEFRCSECGKVTEALLLSSDVRLVKCPECGSESMERLFSSFNSPKVARPRSGHTCCGRTERCERPPCYEGGACRRE